MSTFISICIPAYHRPYGIVRLLDSIKKQTYKNYEIVICDDSTNKEVERAVLPYLKELPIRYYKNAAPLGTPTNWNTAIMHSRYEWIKLMHDDDWFLHHDSLGEFASETKKANFIFCGTTEVQFEKNRVQKKGLDAKALKRLQNDPLLLFYDNLIGHPSNVMFKKNELFFNPKFKWVVDVDFYIRYLLLVPGFEYIHKPLVGTGVDSSAVSAQCYKNPDVEIREYLSLLRQLGEDQLLHNEYIFSGIWTLIKKFRIRSLCEMRKFYPETPDTVEKIIQLQNRLPHIMIKQTFFNQIFIRKSFRRMKNGIAFPLPAS
ncbi:MAG: glycosyltransferase [Chitinophagaceae bacterium]|nr:glycosyltransferase [Chitinophagaceae bacterium]